LILAKNKTYHFVTFFLNQVSSFRYKFSDAVRLLTRPYYPITDVLYEEIMAVIKRLDSDIVVDEQGRQMSFGNADNMYQLMPLMKNS